VNYRICDYSGKTEEDIEIMSLLNRVFVEEAYTEKTYADKFFVPAELQKRGNIKLLGMAIFVPSSSPARQVGKTGESEIQLLAVYPGARERGIGSSIISACEQKAISFGYLRMVLSTQQTMKAAHHFYEKHGYRRNTKRDWSRDENKIYLVYEKILQV